jgi:hypothetical protein
MPGQLVTVSDDLFMQLLTGTGITVSEVLGRRPNDDAVLILCIGHVVAPCKCGRSARTLYFLSHGVITLIRTDLAGTYMGRHYCQSYCQNNL